MRSLSSSFPYSSSLLNRWRVGFKHDTVTEERASVKSRRGPSALLTESRTSVSCQVGTRCLVDLSAARTCVIGLLLFKYPLNHLLSWSPSRGRFSPKFVWRKAKFYLSLRCFFQLCEKNTDNLLTDSQSFVNPGIPHASLCKTTTKLFVYFYVFISVSFAQE